MEKTRTKISGRACRLPDGVEARSFGFLFTEILKKKKLSKLFFSVLWYLILCSSMEFVEVISEPSGELVLEELPVAAPIMEEAINVEVPPHIGWFYDIDAEDVTAETLLQASEHDLRLAFMKLYEHLREGYFELIPRDPNGLIQRVFPDTGRRQELRQKLVRVFGQVKILEDLSEPRARYNFTEEFKDRHLRHFLHSTHTAEYDEKHCNIDCHSIREVGNVIIHFGNENRKAYNKFYKELKRRKVTLHKRTSHNIHTGGGGYY